MLAENDVPLTSKIFQIRKNGSVKQNEAKYIRKSIISKKNNKIIPNKINTVY